MTRRSLDLEALAHAAKQAAESFANIGAPAEAMADDALVLLSNQSRRRFDYPGRVTDPTPFPLLSGDIPDDYEVPS